jgi:amino acid adenylation domain-containing protein
MFCTGNPANLPILPLQYADFAIWQREWLQGRNLDDQLTYWRNQLGKEAHTLELPLDHRRTTRPSYRGSKQRLSIPPSLVESLKILARHEKATLFMVLLAAFNVLLHRLSGQDDIVVGSPIANRNRAETEKLIGFFVNTLALRTRLSGNPTFRTLLGRVREVALGAYSHQDLPFDKLIEEIHPERDLDRTPLIQVMFALHNASLQPLSLPGLAISSVDLASNNAKFELTLSLVHGKHGLDGWLEYSTDLFKEETISRFACHFNTLLEGIVTQPDSSIAELPLLEESERHKTLVEWNCTRTDYPRESGIHELFEAHAKRTPDAVAVVSAGRELTYAMLNGRANALAGQLQSMGVGPGVLVGACLERSAEMIVAWLGILKAGGAYVPLDLEYPPERLAYMIEDSRTRVIVTRKRLFGQSDPHSCSLLYLDEMPEPNEEKCALNPQSGVTGGNLAYVMYTSGSTGKPKPVAVSHRAVSRLVINTNYVQIEPAAVIAQASNSSFDAATFEIWGALLNGARTVVIPRNVLLSPREFAAEIQRQKISILFLTTSLFNQLAAEIPAAFRDVDCLLFGGEAAEPKWVGEVMRHGPPRRLLNVYGPTETTTFATWFPIEELPAGAETIPIGRPISNCRTYVLDTYLQPVPTGVVGTLYIGGDGVACGYLNHPEQTAESFIPDPFAGETGASLYNSGDLARYNPDGTLEFVGRRDAQVKIRGFRIEPAEIESALRHHPGIADAVVIARNDSSGGKQLVAYFVGKGRPAPADEELRAFLMGKLPAYMIPAAFMPLKALPLGPNKKVDRKSLPAAVPDKDEPRKHFVAPRNRMEAEVARLWEQVLNIQPVGIKDNFFDLGGHSLLAVRLLARTETVLGKRLPLGKFFEAPTVEQLCLLLEKEGWSIPWTMIVPLQTGGSKLPFFCIGGSAELAPHLGSDQPYYGLIPHGLDGRRAPRTIEEMARVYIEEIRTIQPMGPYYIGGYSIGGPVVFEMAHQLSRQGCEIALLALLDPTPLAGWKRTPSKAPVSGNGSLIRSKVAGLFAERIHKFLRLRRKQMWKSICTWLKTEIMGSEAACWIACRWYLALGRSLPPNLRDYYLKEVSRHALQQYVPEIYTGCAVLFLTESLGDTGQSWSKLISGGVEVLSVDGRHLEILKEPGIGPLAEKLRARLNRAQQTHSMPQSGRTKLMRG